MAYDGIVAKAIVAELENIKGSKIEKIYEPDQNTITISLYKQGEHKILNICIDVRNYRISLTKHTKINPIVAPNFCMLLRKHITGGIISNIKMEGLERIIQIEIEKINENKEMETKTLIIELMGKHSNIILINKDNKIIDAMRRIEQRKNSYRDILPGYMYRLPKTDKIEITEIKNFEEFNNKIKNKEKEMSEVISETFTGISKIFIENMIKEEGKEEKQIYNNICDTIKNTNKLTIKKIYKNGEISEYVLTKGKKEDTINSLIDDFYYEREYKETFINYRNSILKKIIETQKKYVNRLVNINKKLEECSSMDKYKLYGELITANLYKISNTHKDKIEVENYYTNNEIISIPLNIKYSANINAKNYFKKYNKLKNAKQIVTNQKKETELELKYIESIIYELENCTTREEIQDIEEEISENIIFKEKLNTKNKKKKDIKKKKENEFAPTEYIIDGYKIYVGRNNKENDKLTLAFASKEDYWFHTKDIPGSHVILKREKEITDNILIKVAQIAVKHSKAKLSSNVPVDYCLVKYVKKPSKAKPGMVIFTNNKTINVSP